MEQGPGNGHEGARGAGHEAQGGTEVPILAYGRHGGGDPSVLDANYPPQLTVGQRPLGGGALEGAFKEGRMGGGGSRRGLGAGALREGRLGGGGVQVGQFGVVGGGGHRHPLPPLALPLTIPSP